MPHLLSAPSTVTGYRLAVSFQSDNDRIIVKILIYWCAVLILQQMYTVAKSCTSRRVRVEMVHLQSLLQVYTFHLTGFLGFIIHSCEKRRFWSDCANAQADLNLRSSHMPYGTVFQHADKKNLNVLMELNSAR